MKTKKLIILTTTILLSIGDLAAIPLKVAVVTPDGDLYHQAIVALRGSDLEFIERRDLTPLLKEKELGQAGLTAAKDIDFQTADYLLLVEVLPSGLGGRVVNRAGKIIAARTGDKAEVLKALKSDLSNEAELLELFRAESKGGFEFNTYRKEIRVQAGKNLEFFIEKTTEPSYLYVLLLQSDGEFAVLAPHPDSKEPHFRLRTTDEKAFDFEKEGPVKITAGEPYGVDQVRVIVSRKPIELMTRYLDRQEFGWSIRKGKKGVFSRGLSTSLKKLDSKDWGAQTIYVTVVPKTK